MENLLSIDESELASRLKAYGHPSFRMRQIWDWLYDKRVMSVEQMQNLPRTLRSQLSQDYAIGQLQSAGEQNSADGTLKRLYDLGDGQLIESVLMPYNDGRRTACISSQAGCAMGCVFCATGQMGFSRHLTAVEIFEQAHRFAQELSLKNERLSNIVMMGMGEPFHNYDAVIDAVKMIMHRLNIGARRITISTVGLVKQIDRFAEEGLQVKLAISLHAVDDAKRNAIMPINKRYNVDALIDSCHRYVAATGRRVTFEWALIAGENDSIEEAQALGKLLRGLKCHVNLIPLNPTGGYNGAPSNTHSASAFVETLESMNVPATLRLRRGIDIDAGCGQLKSKALRGKRL